MKRLLILPLLLVSIVFAGCGNETSTTSDDTTELPTVQKETNTNDFTFSNKIPKEGLVEKLENLEQTQHHIGSSFMISVQPLYPVVGFMNFLDDYYTKRYSDAKIAQTYKDLNNEVASLLQNESTFMVLLVHIGGHNDSTAIYTDETFYEYFFLENEHGEYVQAHKQEFENTYQSEKIDWLNSSGGGYISFPKEEVEKLMQDASELHITFDGLDILPDDRIKIDYPYINFYLETFPELESMIEEMEQY